VAFGHVDLREARPSDDDIESELRLKMEALEIKVSDIEKKNNDLEEKKTELEVQNRILRPLTSGQSADSEQLHCALIYRCTDPILDIPLTKFRYRFMRTANCNISVGIRKEKRFFNTVTEIARFPCVGNSFCPVQYMRHMNFPGICVNNVRFNLEDGRVEADVIRLLDRICRMSIQLAEYRGSTILNTRTKMDHMSGFDEDDVEKYFVTDDEIFERFYDDLDIAPEHRV
jgi:hypothetical protein